MRAIKLLTLTAVVIGGLIAAGPADAQNKWAKIRIGTEGAYAPWNFVEGGKLTGFEVELAQDLCKRMKAECEIVPQDWDGIIPALNASKYDAIMAGMNITEKRQEVVSFSRPYAGGPHGFGVPKNSPLVKLPGLGERLSLVKNKAEAEKLIAESKALLKGKVIGVQVSTVNANFLQKYFKDVADIREYKTTEQHDLDLVAGRVDAIYADHSSLLATFSKPDFKDYQVAGVGLTGDILGNGVAVGLRKGDDDLRKLFDEAIAGALADGTIKTLSTKWFKTDMTPQ